MSGPPIRIRNAHNYWVVLRLRDSVSLLAARTELNGIQRRIKEAYPDQTSSAAVSMRPLHEEIVGATRRPLGILMSSSAILLLIACINVASTLLARGASRRNEMAVRSAIGAGRGRLVRQLLSEGLVLGGMGAVGGAVLAQNIHSAIQFGGEARFPIVSPDGRFLFFISGGLAYWVDFAPVLDLNPNGAPGRSTPLPPSPQRLEMSRGESARRAFRKRDQQHPSAPVVFFQVWGTGEQEVYRSGWGGLGPHENLSRHVASDHEPSIFWREGRGGVRCIRPATLHPTCRSLASIPSSSNSRRLVPP